MKLYPRVGVFGHMGPKKHCYLVNNEVLPTTTTTTTTTRTIAHFPISLKGEIFPKSL